jgi:hypothetical protein
MAPVPRVKGRPVENEGRRSRVFTNDSDHGVLVVVPAPVDSITRGSKTYSLPVARWVVIKSVAKSLPNFCQVTSSAVTPHNPVTLYRALMLGTHAESPPVECPKCAELAPFNRTRGPVHAPVSPPAAQR